jgi:hypothetical protein
MAANLLRVRSPAANLWHLNEIILVDIKYSRTDFV